MFYTNQTVQAVLARAEVPALAAKAVWLVAAVALLALIVPVVRRAEPALALVTVAGFALLVSPTSWSHHWVWIAPALLVVVAEAVRRRSRGWAAAAAVLAVTFYVAPFRFLPHEQDQELALDRHAAGGGGDVRDRRDPRAGGGALRGMTRRDARAGRRHEVIRPRVRMRASASARSASSDRRHRGTLRRARAQHRLDEPRGPHPGDRAAGQAPAAAVVRRVPGQQGDAHPGGHQLLGHGEVVDPLDDARARPGLHRDAPAARRRPASRRPR